MSKRRNYSPKFKALAAHAAIQSNATIAEWTQKVEVHPEPEHAMEAQSARSSLSATPSSAGPARRLNEARVHELHANIGELTV